MYERREEARNTKLGRDPEGYVCLPQPPLSSVGHSEHVRSGKALCTITDCSSPLSHCWSWETLFL